MIGLLDLDPEVVEDHGSADELKYLKLQMADQQGCAPDAMVKMTIWAKRGILSFEPQNPDPILLEMLDTDQYTRIRI